MSLPNELLPVGLLGTGAAEGYSIERSVRFNSSDSAYLSKNFASAGNRKTWTWSAWVKRCGLGTTDNILFQAASANTGSPYNFYTSLGYVGDTLYFGNAANYIYKTNAVFRDPSAWYHVVFVLDTTQASTSNRVKIYVNNVLQDKTFQGNGGAAEPTQDLEYAISWNKWHSIGCNIDTSGVANYAPYNLNAYLADIHFIDGQALDPTSFGEFDDNGIWQPIAYSGTYGTNGFHLPFSDNSTAAALGTDTSGNSNTWTVNNISVTAGAGNDSLVDVPTNGTETDTGVGGEVRGNYCVLNPLDKSTNITLTNGNLDYAQTTANGIVRGTIFVSSGKWYWEYTSNGTYGLVGIANASESLSASFVGESSNSLGYLTSALIFPAGSSYGASWTTGDVIGMALDMNAGTMTYYKNGVSQGVAASSLTGAWAPAVGANSTAAAGFLNFGQRPFAHQAPSGFKALCTANLDAPLVTKPSTVMDVALDTGANILSATKALCGGSANFLWIKDRVNGSTNHHLIDIVRDPQLDGTPFLASNSTSNEATLGSYSAPSGNSVGWAWYAGGSTVSNTDGSITSQVRANPSAGFSIVTGTQPSSGSFTVGHGLGVAPHFYIYKRRSDTSGWGVWHTSLAGGTSYLKLFTTDAQTSDSTIWTAAPTSSVLNIGSAWAATGAQTFVTYCFAPVDGYTVASSYTGNGNADGPFVFTNMRPRWILIKRTDSTSNWTIIDTAREGYNVDNDPLFPNLSNAEGTTDLADILSNGFKLRTTDASVNANTGTYIYFAIAETAFNYSRAR